MTSRAAIGLVTVGLLLTIAPLSAADHGPDELALEGATIEEPLRPLGEGAEVHLNVTAPCPERGNATAWVRLAAPEAPGFVVLDTWDQTAKSQPSCSEEDHDLDLQLRAVVRFRQTAPAFQAIDIAVIATGFLNSTNESRPLGPATATITATPSYFSLYNANMETKIQQAGPQEAARYEIVIENFSNGDTWFEFQVQEPLPDGFRAVQPEPMLLNAEATGGSQTNGTVIFTVYTPANTPYTNEIGAIQLNITSYYDGPPEATGQSSELSTITQARGVHVPGPGVGVALLGLVAVALVARRSR